MKLLFLLILIGLSPKLGESCSHTDYTTVPPTTTVGKPVDLSTPEQIILTCKYCYQWPKEMVR